MSRKTYYVVENAGKISIAQWVPGNRISLKEDQRRLDDIIASAEAKGFGWKYEHVSFGPKTTAAIVEQIGYGWSPLAAIWERSAS